MDGSPNVDAGVQARDVIETVDGGLVSEIGVPALRYRFRREGQVIRLGLRRGTERIMVTLVCGAGGRAEPAILLLVFKDSGRESS